MATFEHNLSFELKDNSELKIPDNIRQELNKATDIYNNFKNLDTKKALNVKEEYEEARTKSIDIFKSDKSITRGELDNLLIEIKDVLLVWGENFSIDWDKYWKTIIKYNSNWAPYTIRERRDNLLEEELTPLKYKADKFLDSNLSLSDLDARQIGGVLSITQAIWGDYREKLVSKLSQDTKGLIFLKDNWWKGINIDKYNQFWWETVMSLVSDIVESTWNAIDLEIKNLLISNWVNLNKEEIIMISKDISKLLSKWQWPRDIIQALELILNMKWDNSKFIKFLWKIIGLNSVKLLFVNQKAKLLKDSKEDKLYNNNLSNLEEEENTIFKDNSLSIEEKSIKLEDLSNKITLEKESIKKIEEEISKLDKEISNNKISQKKSEKEEDILNVISKSEDLSNQYVNDIKDGLSDKKILDNLLDICKNDNNLRDFWEILSNSFEGLWRLEDTKTLTGIELSSIIAWEKVVYEIVDSKWFLNLNDWKMKYELTYEETNSLYEKNWNINEEKLNSLLLFVKDLKLTWLDFLWEKRDLFLWKFIENFDIKNWITKDNLNDMKNMLCKLLKVDNSISYNELRNNLVLMNVEKKVPELFSNNKILSSMDLEKAVNDTTKGSISWPIHAYLYEISFFDSCWINYSKDLSWEK